MSSTAFAFNLSVFFFLFIRHIFLLFRFQVINLNTAIVLLREQQKFVVHVRVKWSGVEWSEVKWSEVKWSEVKWSEVKWSEVKWSEVKWSEVQVNNFPILLFVRSSFGRTRKEWSLLIAILTGYMAGANKFSDYMVLCLSGGNGNNS